MAHTTGWITRGQLERSPAAPRLPAGREDVLKAILDPARLPALSATAVRVAAAACRPDCRLSDLAPIIAADPGLSAALLRALSAAREGPSRGIAPVDRAVLIVGLNRVRALALTLSLPAMRPQSRFDPAAVAHSLSSIGGAIFARELAARLGRPAPEEDLNAALLRDVGVLLIQQTYPEAWAELAARPGDPLGEEACVREREVFGTDHAEVGAEVLRRWGLSEDVVEPVRHHHAPERLAGSSHADRAELLWFAGLLARLDTLAEHPAALDRVLAVAADRFALPLGRLAEFLDRVRPEIDRFADAMDREIGRCPDYAWLLEAAVGELGRGRPSG